MDFYDFNTAVTQDITLTAVWNDTINPNNPTLRNLYNAGAAGIAKDIYPVGTEIPHTDTGNKDNPWVIMHYGTMEVLDENEQSVMRNGVILGLKYADTTTVSLTYDAAQATTTCMTAHLRDLSSKLTEEESSLTVPVVTTLGAYNVFMPEQKNMTLGDEDVWEYYSLPVTYYNRIVFLATYWNNTTLTLGPYSYSSMWYLRGSGFNIIPYVSANNYMTSVSFSSRTMNTSNTYTVHPKYCIFMPFIKDEESE